MIRTMVALAAAGVMIGGYAEAAPKAAAAKGKAAASAYRAPRGPDKIHPDLNGVWQVMNSANWDIEPHAARAALQIREDLVGASHQEPVDRFAKPARSGARLAGERA